MIETLISVHLVYSEQERNPDGNGLMVSSIHSTSMLILRLDAQATSEIESTSIQVIAEISIDMTSLFEPN